DVGVLVRHHRLRRVAAAHLAPADHERDVGAHPGHLREARLELGALGTAGCVGLYGLVDGRGHAANAAEGEIAGHEKRPLLERTDRRLRPRTIAKPPVAVNAALTSKILI